MANKLIRGLTVTIGADTSKLSAAVKEAEAQVRGAKTEIREIQSALSKAGDSAELWQQKQTVLTTAIESSKKKLDELKMAQKSLTEQLRDGDIDQKKYDEFQAKLTKARDRLSELKKQQENVEAQFKSGSIDKEAYEKFTDRVHRAELKVRDLETAEHSLEENVRLGNVSEEQYRAFQREIQQTEGDIRYFERQLETTGSKLDSLASSADDAGDESKELGDEIRDSGESAEKAANGGFTVLKGALSDLVADGIRTAAHEIKDFAGDVVQTGMTFEAAMSGVGAIAGATDEELERLTEKAEEMGAGTKFTAAQSAEAFQYMAMAGWKAEDMLSGIDGVLSLAAASGENLGTTSDIVTDALTAFGLTAADTQHFVDVLAAASSNANTNVAMMGETFKYAAPIAGALGFSVEDTAEAVGLMANAGIKASQAGTSLRTIMTNLSEGVSLTGEAFGELAVQTSNGDGTMRDFGDILDDLRSGWEQLTETERAANAENIAGKNAMSGFLALMNAAPEDVAKLSGAIAGCDEAAGSMAETMQDNLAGDITLLESAVDGMKISLARELTPVLRDVVQYATDKMPDIQDMLAKLFTAGGKLLRGAVDYLPKIADTGKKLIPVITGIGAATGGLKIAGTLKPAAEAAVGLAKAFTGVNGAAILSAGGIAGVAAAVLIGTGSYIYAAKKAEKARLDEVYRAATKEADGLAESIHNDKKKIDELSQAAQEQVRTDFADIYITENLFSELQTLVNENGRVKDGYEERASYIANELTAATGVEIELVDGVIQKYDELGEKITDTIARQKADIFLNAYTDTYSEALRQNEGAAEKIHQIEDNIADNERKIEEYRARLKGKYHDSGVEDELNAAIAEFGELNADNYMNYKKFMSPDWYSEVSGFADSIIMDNISLRSEKAQIARNNYMIEQYEKAEQAYLDGSYTRVQRYAALIDNVSLAALNNQTTNQEEAVKNFEELLGDAVRTYKTETELGIKDAKKRFGDSTDEAFRYLTEQCGISTDEARKIAIKKLSQIDHFDASALFEFGQATGMTLGEIIGGMTRQKMTEEISTALSLIDTTTYSFGGIFSGVGQKLANIGHSAGFFASGGVLREGEGIVAEAGPELIRIIGGAAHITPLTDNARNTAVSDSTRSVIYNQISVNATVSSDMDINRLGEKLALATQRSQTAKGL